MWREVKKHRPGDDSPDAQGCVNFPVDDPRYTNSSQGGMLVRLVVMEPGESRWARCAGGDNYFDMDIEFHRDDRRMYPELRYESEAALRASVEARNGYDTFHFPRITHQYHEEQFRSAPYLAVLTIGSTRWCGYDVTTNEPWHCTYNDLTAQGKAIYDALAGLYQGCELYLLTFVDT
jgi:hypothetical protein